jgi:hypothetical protein
MYSQELEPRPREQKQELKPVLKQEQKHQQHQPQEEKKTYSQDCNGYHR